MPVLLLKLTLMPSVVALITLAIRRWGHQIGGLIGSMPWVAGAILLFFILEQGTQFGINAVQGIMTGIVALLAFCFSYAWFSKRYLWALTLTLSYGIYTATALSLNYLALPLVASYAVTMVSILVALYFFPVPAAAPKAGKRLKYDILIRMAVATLFTLGITGLAELLGPTWSGVLTPFPILTSILAIFSHLLQGSDATVATMRGIVIGLLGFTTFLFLQAFLLREFPVGLSFFLAFLVNAIINVAAARIYAPARRGVD
ncbi:hypothetical protein BLX24_15650 [Arsenicibacter rosenii]|uniref:Uncharacterized protein n=1 Tax=Arsenicibacter rosenii TaxID=1750698 RepID=A0A1S2VJB8_9BACT|nr:hypothetical protein BLX24_15650 [Arsenicibacter rosenii]